jgi:hypothetical protein
MKRISMLAARLLAAVPLPAGASDLVVLESNVPAYAAGTSVPARAMVTLDVDARLVFITGDGSTVIVEGPFTGPIWRAAAGRPGVIERLTTRRERSHRFGATRSLEFGKGDGGPSD